MTLPSRLDNMRVIRAPHGTERTAKSWLTEAPMRMLMNNLDPDVAERPGELVVYGGIGRAARDWNSFDKIVETLRRLDADDGHQIPGDVGQPGHQLVAPGAHPAGARRHRQHRRLARSRRCPRHGKCQARTRDCRGRFP